MSSSNTNEQYRELDLSQSADLVLFLESVREVGEMITQYDAVAARVGYARCAVPDVSGEEIFATAREKYEALVRQIEQFLNNIVPLSEMTDRDVASMQTRYNELTLLRDHVADVYESVAREQGGEVPAPPAAARATVTVAPPTSPIPPVQPVTPQATPASLAPNTPSSTEDIEAYRATVRAELAQLLKQRGVPKIKQRLDRTIGRAKTRAEIDQRKAMLERETERRTPQKEQAPKPQAATPKPVESMRPASDIILLGVPLPSPGPAGLPASMALREKLLIARDQHPQLRNDHQKQLLIDKVIRMLQVVPQGGLRADVDIPKLTAYAQAINLPEAFHPSTATADIGSVSAPAPVSDHEPIEYIGRIRRKDMQIDVDDDEAVVPIVVAGREADSSETHTELEAVSAEVVAAVEQRDPVNVVQPEKRETVIHPRRDLAAESLTATYLLENPEYQSFITAYYTTPEAFERMLDATVTQIESETIDAFERWLGEEQVSPFGYLKGMTVNTVVELSHDRDVRRLLQTKNIKYDGFVTWIDLLPVMQELVEGEYAQMTFGELYARWMIESAMQYVAQVGEE